MPTVSQDRRQGVNAGAALKVPVRVATTANITLSGLQTIDGVTLSTDDRVLVKNQTDASDNGIYTATTSTWQRTPDFDGQFDVQEGTLVYVNRGSTQDETLWRVTTSGEITIGEDDIEFEQCIISESESISFLQSGTGARLQDLQTKNRRIVHVTDFQNSDGSAISSSTGDNSTGIQRAIDAVRPSGESPPFATTAYVYFPRDSGGRLPINSPINLYSGVGLIGEGEACGIEQGSSFSGTALVLLKGQGSNLEHRRSTISNMGFECTGTVWAIKASATDVIGNCRFQDIYLSAGFGIDLGTYTQACLIDGIWAEGAVNQILHLKGNHNVIRHVDKEGSTGTTTDPYILVEGHTFGASTGNSLDDILIQQVTSANKSLIKLDNCETTMLDRLWLEPTSTDGYGLRILNCKSTRIRRFSTSLTSATKLKIDTSQSTLIDDLDCDGDDVPWWDFVEIDGTSDIDIQNIYNRRAESAFQLSKLDRNVQIGRFYQRTIFTEGVTTYSPVLQVRWTAGQNLLTNGSFEAGNYGWTWSSTPTTTEEYITSEVGAGLMGHFVWAASGTYTLSQSITVPAGMPVTFTAKVKMSSGSFITPDMFGVGISSSTSYSRVSSGDGWQIISLTGIPTSAGSLSVGFSFVSATEVYVDEASCSVGAIAVPNQGKFGSLEIGGKTHTSATSAPATGTWKQGDIVWNSAPSAGGTPGWVCTAAGSPGTWKAMASVAA